jgi:2-aminoadipate transaminase
VLATDAAAAPVIHLGSFSKTLAPGLRLGYAIADERTVRALTIAKQATDLHSGTLAQRAVSRLFETFDYDAHLRRLRTLYGERLDAMLASLERSFPARATWTRPEGGLFVWVRLPHGLDAQKVLADPRRPGAARAPLTVRPRRGVKAACERSASRVPAVLR